MKSLILTLNKLHFVSQIIGILFKFCIERVMLKRLSLTTLSTDRWENIYTLLCINDMSTHFS